MSPVTPGTAAPEFSLPDQERRPVALADLRGRAVVLVFYPFAFSRVCGSELAALRDNLPEFQNETTQVLAVSVDSVHALRAWSEREEFGYPLLSDFWPHGAVAGAYGVLDEQTGAARRATFVIDRDGVVRWSVVNPIPEARNLADYRAVLAGL